MQALILRLTLTRYSMKYIQGVPKKRTNKTNKNGQTWQARQHSKVVQRGPKGSKMVNLDAFDNLGPFWAHLDPFGQFQTKINLLPRRTKKGLAIVPLSKKSFFV